MKVEGGLAYLTAVEMAEVDRSAIGEYGIDVLTLMENAGLGVAGVARMMLQGKVEGSDICCLVGKGNNGGDGLVAARHLHNWGARVVVAVGGDPGDLRDVPARQLDVVRRMGIPVALPPGGLGEVDLIVDALLGYGAKGNPREPAAGLIRRANASRVPILAVDIPSGLDATTGEVGDPCVAAKATVTFGFPKTGFLGSGARSVLGELYLADISLPAKIYAKYSQSRSVFAGDTLVRIL